ncbi:hypothetical protein GALMADRAFT_218179 [Galerina marginata CBS 339.88]|uniref:BZIP domain-containing protein n=1 Tax=Galerina marginata (strain CBS 339.88) TaxID=685588 RepID=A0A067TPG3_GALM3|nr:hypothetical protein GALMADRAFT_218179 [Galerina marginata CBS 339.88]
MASTNASSSSTNLWATASKEWVIQPKPKPGRKPKDPIPSAKADIEQPDPKGRRIQNRAAQRAFRERKQSQLSELQARIQAYEQGEIEKNIALQNVAKRLKEENECLRQENQELKSRISQMEPPSELSLPGHLNSSQATEKKRWRDESPSTSVSTQAPAPKRPRKNSGPDSPRHVNSSAIYFPSPSSTMVSTPESNDMADSRFSPICYNDQNELDSSAFSRFSDLSVKDAEETLAPFPSFGCGFCDEGTICVCHEIAVQHVTDTNEFKSDDFGGTRLLATQDTVEAQQQSSTEAGCLSILDNLPAYQPPVALRKRTGGTLVNSVFPVKTTSDPSLISDANCSGDPSNCLACGDDAFGKAFCAAIENSTSMQQSVCDTCPSKLDTDSSAPRSKCCGRPCCTVCPSSDPPAVTPSFETTGFMPTNAAWRKLKSHPNVEFADLSLLAEVVSSRSKCSGPQLVTSPALQPHRDSPSAIDHILDAPRRGGHSPPPRLVPQEVLLECGRRRLRHVHTDGVREALRILDAKFS